MLPLGAASINFSIIGVALQAIGDGFRAPPDFLAWVISIHPLPMMISMLCYGKLADGLGKQRLPQAGLTVSLLGALISYLAPAFGVLLVGRAV